MNSTEPKIKWSHFEELYKLDNQNLCPKITSQHITLNNSLKMRVSLAVQIFSCTVARALLYYKTYTSALQDSSSTIQFCTWMNELFDALNRSQLQGLTVDTPDFKVLEDSLSKLDKWEDYVNKNIIDKSNFLTKQTAHGLRVSLHSMINLIKYLTTKYEFDSIPTSRFNQDALERFFGKIRQSCSTNDHPTNITFLQLYKIHSVFSILKPPKKGNCSVVADNSEPLISLAEIKSIFQNADTKAVEMIKQRIEVSVSNDDWDFNDIIDNGHDYCSPEIINCIAYCLTAYITKRMSKVSCQSCVEIISVSHSVDEILPIGVSPSGVTPASFSHTNKKLYNFILKLENLFQKHSSSPHVSDLVVNDAIIGNLFNFPCNEHKVEILSTIVAHYLQIRMRQFCFKANKNKEKINQLKKKQSKFCKT